jgi:hypothetical protein
MKSLLFTLALLAALPVCAFDDDAASEAKYYIKKLEEQVAVAKDKPDAPSAWQQCEGTLQGTEAAVAKLPAAARAPYAAKIAQFKPAIVAGAARNRASNLARSIRNNLDSAKADIAAGNNKYVNLQEAYFGKLDQQFAEADLKALPSDELKKLLADYAEVKKGAVK